MHWPSFLIGLGVVPGIALLALAALVLLSRTTDGYSCDDCDWCFAGGRANYERRDDEEPSTPLLVHSWLSRQWHQHVVTRTRAHRAAWTRRVEGYAEGGLLREKHMPHARRMGTRDRARSSANERPRP